MKKNNLLILAVAALGFAACANDETTAVNEKLAESNAISFRAFNSGMMRAAVVNLPTNGFWVTALKQGQTPSTENTYFDNVHFTGSSTYTSEHKYYWPSAYNLDFYAYSPAAADATDVVRTTYKTFDITANATAANQVDFVYANTNDWGKAALQTLTDATHRMGAADAGVKINFRHAESKVIIKLKNMNPNVKFTVGDVTIGNLSNSGTFTYKSTNTDGEGADKLTNAEWESLSATTSVYTQTVADGTAYSTSTSAKAGDDMILIPQTLVNKTQYTKDDGTTLADAKDDPFKGAYIKVQLKMQNNKNDAYILGTVSTWVEAMWPLAALQWQPGYQYTYEVDLSGGGYFPANNDTDPELDPILEGAEIKFVEVTVDSWTDYATNPIPVPVPAP